MKRPDNFLTNTDTPTGRSLGAATNNPGDNTGSGMDEEIYNDPAYAALAVIDSYKEDGISNTDETLDAADLRDAIEEITEKAVDSVDEWDSTTIFGIGDLCMYKGYQFVSFTATNQNNTPIGNPDLWMKCWKSDKLMDAFWEGEPLRGGQSKIADRAHANYQQNILVGKYRLGESGDDYYNFYRVALDGTTLTGDATLEAIFDPGGSNEYWNIDAIAPDSGGTRTFIDVGGDSVRFQESSGDFATVGGKVDDQFQGHLAKWGSGDNNGSFNNLNYNVGTAGGTYPNINNFTAANTGAHAQSLGTDGTNGTPRTGTRTYGPTFVTGAGYIIVMVAA